MNKLVSIFIIGLLFITACAPLDKKLKTIDNDLIDLAKDNKTLKTVKIAAMGDIMLGNENALPEDDGENTFAAVVPYLTDRDVVFGNLEGPLTDKGSSTKNTACGRSYVFRSPPEYVRHLKYSKFTIMGLANNHVYDYGKVGRDQTVEKLEEMEILHVGAPEQITVQEANGLNVAFIGLAPNYGCQDINDIKGMVRLIKKALEIPKTLVVVTFHGGAEGPSYANVPHGQEIFYGERRGNLRKLSHEAIDAGASLVIGHGPHVPRGIEIYKGRVIAYSLGNFSTGIGISTRGKTGLAPLLLVELNENGDFVEGEIVSFKQSYGVHPHLDLTNEAATLMYKLSKEDFNENAGLNEKGKIVVQTK